MGQICATIARRRHSKVFEEMDAAVDAGAELIEIRLDFLSRPPRLDEFLARRRVPIIVTARLPEDGGLWRKSEEERLKVLRTAIAMGFDYVDLEMETADLVPRYGSTKRIVSYHSFEGTPDDQELNDLYRRLASHDADFVKIATKAKHVNDVFRMMNLLRHVNEPAVAFCMGDLGTASRVMGAKFGCPFMYSAFNAQRGIAPGMLTFADMKFVYFYDRIDSGTEFYGVMGDPIEHSFSPLVHNAAFRELGLNKAYLPFRVPREQFVEFIDEVTHDHKNAPVQGWSVTIPHKQAVRHFGVAGDELVPVCKAANTAVLQGETFVLYNTDAPAAIEALREAVSPHPETGARTLADRTVLILGAGGVAHTLAVALTKEGALVSITGRNEKRLEKLAADAGVTTVPWGSRHQAVNEIVVNCTPVGMHPNIDATPMHPGEFGPGTVVFDTIYNPEHTVLIKDAQKREARTVTGVEMFVRQAEAQFRLFTGQAAPRGLMRRLCREALSPGQNMLREARLKESGLIPQHAAAAS